MEGFSTGLTFHILKQVVWGQAWPKNLAVLQNSIESNNRIIALLPSPMTPLWTLMSLPLFFLYRLESPTSFARPLVDAREVTWWRPFRFALVFLNSSLWIYQRWSPWCAFASPGSSYITNQEHSTHPSDVARDSGMPSKLVGKVQDKCQEVLAGVSK